MHVFEQIVHEHRVNPDVVSVPEHQTMTSDIV